MSVVIPNEVDERNYAEQVTLDGVVYTFAFRWSGREGSWYMDVLTATDEPILMGTKVVPTWRLGRSCKDPRFPPGAIICLDSSGQDSPPGLHDLGARVTLVYLTAAEVAEIETSLA